MPERNHAPEPPKTPYPNLRDRKGLRNYHREWDIYYDTLSKEALRLQIETERRLNQTGLLEAFINSAQELRQSHGDAHVHLRFPPEGQRESSIALRLAWDITRTHNPGPEGIRFNSATCQIGLEGEAQDGGIQITFGEDYGPFHTNPHQAKPPTIISSADPDFITRSRSALAELIKNPQLARDHTPYPLLGRLDKVLSQLWYIIDSAEREATRNERSRIKILYPQPIDIKITKVDRTDRQIPEGMF